MALLDQLQKDMAAAMKARDEARLSTLRMMKTALMKEKVDSMKNLDEAAELKVLNSLIKQRKDAAELYRQGGRPELAEKEEAEMKVIESYMPASATEEELAAAVTAALEETGAASAKQMGQVIAAARARLAGKRIDGKRLSDLVKARLS
ncbi:MAG: GatB/YqeY domain-containing protein [Acidobacteriota bacterium]